LDLLKCWQLDRNLLLGKLVKTRPADKLHLLKEEWKNSAVNEISLIGELVKTDDKPRKISVQT